MAQRVADEATMLRVSNALTNIEGAIKQAQKGIDEAKKLGGNPNVPIALEEALVDLKRIHKRLMQETYYKVDTRMF